MGEPPGALGGAWLALKKKERVQRTNGKMRVLKESGLGMRRKRPRDPMSETDRQNFPLG